MSSPLAMKSWWKNNASLLVVIGLIWLAVLVLSGYLRSGSPYRLVFELKSNQGLEQRFAQVYYDLGVGYNEKDSAIRKLSTPDAGVATVSFDIPSSAHGGIRIDPVDHGDIDLVLSNMRIVNPKGLTATWIDMRQLASSGKMALSERGERTLRLQIGGDNNDPILLANLDASIWDLSRSDRSARALNSILIGLAVYVATLGIFWCIWRGVGLNQAGRWRVLVFSVLTVTGFMVLIVRSPDAIFSPILYTEDGSWLSSLMTRGFLTTMIDARPDYLVWGNVLTLELARCLNWLFAGDSLRYLPIFVAVVSYAFYAVLFAIAYTALRPLLGPWLSTVAWLLMLFVPLGGSANEIYGRLSNIGYSVPVLVVCLCIIRERILLRGQVEMAACVDVVLLICACTNPLAIPMVGLLWLVDFTWRFDYTLKERRAEKAWAVAMLVLLAALAAFTAYRIHYFGTKVLGEALILSNFVPAFIGRMFDYPVVFPLYVHLNDHAAVLLFLVGVVAYVWAFIVTKVELRRILLLSGAVLGAYAVSTMAMRPGITHIITDYTQTFPDRYYMGQSLLVIIVMCLVVRAFFEKGWRKSAVAALSIVCSLYLASLPSLIEWGQPKLTLMTGLNYQDQVRQAWHKCQADPACGKSDADIKVPTYFDGWIMVIPRKNAEATVNDLN